jgi:hypothetical protein
MLDHLINSDFEPVVHDARPASFTPIEKATPDQTIDAQVNTADWIKDLGLDDDTVNNQSQTQAARSTFAALTTGASPQTVQNALTTIKTPAAVQHLVGMLTAYDWEFVEQAKNLRGYTVAKLLEECENPNANIRLKALGLLGKVTEVGLFTEKIEVKKTDMSDDEIDARIKEKLNKFMGVVDVVDVEDASRLEDESGNDQEPDAD